MRLNEIMEFTCKALIIFWFFVFPVTLSLVMAADAALYMLGWRR